MTRRIERLTLDNLGDLPEASQCCLFWQADPVTRARVEAEGVDALRDEKQAWLSTVLRDWGSCGRVAYVDDLPVGFALYAPPVFFPGTAALPTAPLSEDAVQLATMYVDPHYRGHGHSGLGRVLVQAMAKDLIKGGEFRAVEAIGWNTPTRPWLARAPKEHECVLPAEFLVRVGFKSQRAHPTYPRLRMDLKSVLTWRQEVEHALQKLVGVVRPQAKPSTNPIGSDAHWRIES